MRLIFVILGFVLGWLSFGYLLDEEHQYIQEKRAYCFNSSQNFEEFKQCMF